MRTRLLIVVLVLLVTPGILYSGVTGKLKGTVTNRTTGEPLIGVNVIIEGTTLGAATNENGDFFIINIPPGRYTVQFSYIGFRVQSVEQVQIIADYTTPLDTELSEEALAAQEVVVTAQQEIIKRDMTATAHFASKEEIVNMPVNSFTEVMNTTSGFIVSNNIGGRGNYDNGIHVRGGRVGEVGFYVDGFYMEDALNGGQGGDVARLGIQDLSIITGTFNAEYGQAMSGVVNIVTPEGGNTYDGQLRVGTDMLIEHFDWGSKRIEGSLSGPLPGFGNKVRFFVTADDSESDTYLAENYWVGKDTDDPTKDKRYSLPFDTYDFQRRITEKLTITPMENMKISIGGNHSRHNYKLFNTNYFAYPEGAPKDRRDSDMFNVTWTQTLSPATFFNVKGSWFERRFYAGMFDDFNPNNKADLARIRLNRRTIFDEDLLSVFNGTGGFDNYEAFATSNYEYWGPYQIEDDSWWYPNYDTWQKYESKNVDFMFDITSQVNTEHLVKAGFEYRTFDIFNHRITGINIYGAWDQDTGEYLNDPADATRDHDSITKFNFKPRQASFYIQDKMEFENMILNLGGRIDYLDVDAKGLRGGDHTLLSQSTGDVYEDVKSRYEFSPRVGFGYPITDRAVLHFAYGQFTQFPDFRHFYNRWNENLEYPDLSQGYEPSLGNPSLKPERTTAYELGTNWLVSDDIAVDITVYYKDVYDFISTKRINISPMAYTAIVNMDYANSRGIEFSVNKRFSNHWALRGSYTYSRAEGNADNWETHFDEIYTASVTGLVPPKSTNTLVYDQPHTLTFVLDYRYPDNWGVNFLGNFGSGLPYTPTDARGKYTGKANSGRQSWTGNLNMRMNKDFLIGGLRYQLWGDVRNLLNKTNILNVFNNSGRPDHSTNPAASPIAQFNPEWYGAPRHVELGFSIIF
ncbi:TonB-dependent receptor domain-containing protein [candidate division KSB1 bacterium]